MTDVFGWEKISYHYRGIYLRAILNLHEYILMVFVNSENSELPMPKNGYM